MAARSSGCRCPPRPTSPRSGRPARWRGSCRPGSGFSLPDTSIFGVYVGFLAALSLRGWIELAFLTGVITGPNNAPLPARVTEGERFLRAWGTVAHHEMLLLVALIGLTIASSGADNHFGVTFAVLYFARISAKLNIHLGVPKIQIDFLPDALSHLPSHFRVRAMNWPACASGWTRKASRTWPTPATSFRC